MEGETGRGRQLTSQRSENERSGLAGKQLRNNEGGERERESQRDSVMSTSGVTRSSRLKVSNDEPLVSPTRAFSKPTGEASAGHTVELTEDLGEGCERKRKWSCVFSQIKQTRRNVVISELKRCF